MRSTASRTRHVVFLLGSGASRPAGLPLVPDITARVRSGDRIICHSSGTYGFCDDPDTLAQYRVDPEVVELVQHLEQRIRPFYEGYKPAREPNYEDIAYVTRQVADSLMREYENPALLPFIEELCARLKSKGPGRAYRLCGEATKYIKGVTTSMLAIPPTRTDHLAAVLGACNEAALQVTIASMNHDCVLEMALSGASVTFHDGFVGPDGDVFTFQDAFPDDGQTVLLKLHGSIDWFRYQVPDTRGKGKRSILVRSPNPEKDHLRDGSGRELGFRADFQPQILVGTFSKILDYASFVFVDLHARLHQALKRADRLVIIGYGCQDKAINSRIIHWMDEDPSRQAVLVDPSPDKLLKTGRPAIQANLSHWQKSGRLRVIPRGVEQVSWDEIDGG